VGPFFVPGSTGCYACYEAAFRDQFPDLEIVLEQRRARLNPAGSLGPACGMIGGQVALEVLHLLTGLAEPSTQGEAQIYDLRTMGMSHAEVTAQESCPICSHLL
jgi:bacteriocin biosynthesis cyclodehydratase domain-containing protein